MRTVIRVDAASHIGSGHLARCVTLARQLIHRGASVTFVVRDHEPGWYGRVAATGLPIVLLEKPDGATPPTSDDYRTWVGVPQSIDAEQTLGAIGPHGCDLLVVDHYGLDAAWERQLRTASRRIMAIDDVLDRRHDVDVLLDQNLSAPARAGGDAGVRVASELLLGPCYALLDETYRNARDLRVVRPDVARRVVVYFGGADPAGLTLRTLKVLAEPSLEHLEVDVVLGPATAERGEIERLASSRGKTRTHTHLPSLAGLLVDCDVAIGGAGATSWERACLGVPSIVVALAANQLVNARSLDHAGAARYLGTVNEAKDADLQAALDELVTDASLRRSMGDSAAEMVDGWGVVRVAEVLMPSSPDAVVVRPAAEAMSDALSALSPADDGASSFAVVLDDLPIGAATVTDRNEEIEIDLDLDELVARRGWDDVVWWRVASAYRRSRVALGSRSSARAPIVLEGRRAEAGRSRRIGVVSDAGSWINRWLPELLGSWLRSGHRVDWGHDSAEVADSDLCFFLSHGHVLRPETRGRHSHNLSIHAGDLPRGRGSCPIACAIVGGDSTVTVSLVEAAEEVNAHRVYAQRQIELQGHELIAQWRAQLIEVVLELCDWSVTNFEALLEYERPQVGAPIWMPRRHPDDSRIDPNATIARQFDLLRVVDNVRYPGFFDYRGHRYRLAIELVDVPEP